MDAARVSSAPELTARRPAPAKSLIKSKARVQKHGEVFTPQWMVEYMCDIVDSENPATRPTFSLTETILEPAAGDGNFLMEILERKLATARQLHGMSLPVFEAHALLALSSIYGVELLTDNYEDCRNNLYQRFGRIYTQVATVLGKSVRNHVLEAAWAILGVNIINGNFLTKLDVRGNPITIYWWHLSNDDDDGSGRLSLSKPPEPRDPSPFLLSFTTQPLAEVGQEPEHDLFSGTRPEPRPTTLRVTELTADALAAEAVAA